MKIIPYEIESEFRWRFTGVDFDELVRWVRRSLKPEHIYSQEELRAAIAELKAESNDILLRDS